MFDYHIYKVKYNIISHSNTPAIDQPYMILHIAKTNNNIEKVTKNQDYYFRGLTWVVPQTQF